MFPLQPQQQVSANAYISALPGSNMHSRVYLNADKIQMSGETGLLIKALVVSLESAHRLGWKPDTWKPGSKC